MPKTSKVQRPPTSRSKIRRRLDRAIDEQGLVDLRLWIPQTDSVEGFVVARSKGWVLLARLSGQILLDGWAMVRVGSIQAVTRYPVEECFEIKALKARDQWPPRAPEHAELDTVSDVLGTALAFGPMVTVFREFERPAACWIGAAQKITDDTLSLLEVNLAGGWARKPHLFDLEDITRVDFGGGYEQALRLVAGPPPRVRAAKVAAS